MRTFIVAVVALFICPGAVDVAVGAPRQGSHQFSAYPASVYRGAVVEPAFRGAQRPYARYRTMIRRSVADGVKFAGRYAVAIVGCGSSCRFGYITDLSTGRAYDLPLGGEQYPVLTYRARPDSRLLQAQWEIPDDGGMRPSCALEDFVWTGRTFRSLGTRRTAQCAEWSGALSATD